MGKELLTRKNIAIGAVALLIVFASFLPQLINRHRLTIDVFDIGQGDSTLITTPTGEHILVDGGPDASVVAKLSQRLGFFDRTIDLVIATHPQADHITGLLSVLDRFTVKRVMLTTIKNETPEYRVLREKITEKHVARTDIADAPHVDFGDSRGVSLDVLWPERSYSGRLVDDPNIVSAVFRLTYGEASFLFTGDAGSEIEQQLLEGGADLHADVLKVGHHGSDTSTTQAFLDAVLPSVAVISVGRKNTFGHPSRRVLRRLERAGSAIYRTDSNGDVHITSDGKEIRVTPQLR
ncbi:MAG: ComEC/Rec2 family competence protein [bacterium]|nr:ComEC/Rec2 family competence protein [bacterium]